MLEKLPDALSLDAAPEYLFITGDLRYGKNCGSEFPEEIAVDINRLASACAIAPERVHIVMGNHDVTLENSRAIVAADVQKKYFNGSSPAAEALETLELSQHKFYDVYKSICKRDPSPYHALVKEKDLNIICLNTAFACEGEGDDGNLIVGMESVQKALKGIDKSKPGIVLAHHGFASLQKAEQMQLETKLKESGALLYLCGHEHMATSRSIAARREGTPLIEYTCGTGMDKLPSGQPSDMVIFTGKLDTEKKSGSIRALKWDTEHSAWFPYQGFSYEQTGKQDGVHYFPVPPQYATVAPSVREEAMRRYKLTVQCNAPLPQQSP
jgi:predicted MPP superfamily phosphohydrolase